MEVSLYPKIFVIAILNPNEGFCLFPLLSFIWLSGWLSRSELLYPGEIFPEPLCPLTRIAIKGILNLVGYKRKKERKKENELVLCQVLDTHHLYHPLSYIISSLFYI